MTVSYYSPESGHRFNLSAIGRSKLRAAEWTVTENELGTLTPAPGRLADLAFESAERSAEVLTGRHKLMACLPEIRQLRLQCGQQDDLTTDPEYFIAANALKDRRIAVVLIRRERTLEACVLFYEHCKFGIGLGLMRGGDATGGGFVTGTDAFHLHYANLAAQALLRQWRMHGVSFTIHACLQDCAGIMGPRSPYQTLSARNPKHKLMLAASYVEMLAGMGHRTRRSLATKRRQLEQTAGVVFLPAMEPDQASEAMAQLRTRSWPVRIREFFDARRTLLDARPELFCMGLRLPDGTWLSVVSGWRRGRVTFIDLQMNDKHYKKESISAVMRAFVLEHEISLGQHMISFVGGCSVLLGRYCESGEACTDVVMRRPGLRSALLQSLIPWIKPESRYERLNDEQGG